MAGEQTGPLVRLGAIATEPADAVDSAPPVRPAQSFDAKTIAVAAKTSAVQALALGQLVSLMVLSPLHRNSFLSELEWRIYPPLVLNQYRVFYRAGQPIAFVTWALVTEDLAARLEAEAVRLQPGEWRCGLRPVVTDIVAPFGGAQKYLDEIRTLLATRPVTAMKSPVVDTSKI